MAEEEVHIPMIRMEEEEDTDQWESRPIGFGGAYTEPQKQGAAQEAIQDLIGKLIQERQTILADTTVTPKERLKLLESNHRSLLILRGGHFKTFKTEQVVYAILVFSGVALIALALLNVFAGLPSNITLVFVGTILGGTIATIAQKLGRIDQNY
jgi:hypothetical protein